MSEAEVSAILPVLKIDVNEPVEMIAFDCVSLPRTSRGDIGIVVAMDHKSKFAYAGAIKDKTCSTLANTIRDDVLPMCV